MSDNNQPELGSPIITSITADAPIPTEGAAKAELGPDDDTKKIYHQKLSEPDRAGNLVTKQYPIPESQFPSVEAGFKAAPKRADITAEPRPTPQQVDVKAMQSLSTEPSQVLNEKEWADFKDHSKTGTIPAPTSVDSVPPVSEPTPVPPNVKLPDRSGDLNKWRQAGLGQEKQGKLRSLINKIPFIHKKAS
jgi:hypothetical protein